MAATPYKGAITIKNVATGEVAVQPFTVSDVAAAYVSYTNTSNNFINAPGNKGQQCFITDIMATAATDTYALNLRVSQKDTGITILCAGILPTINNRIPQPIPIQGGSSVQLKQL